MRTVKIKGKEYPYLGFHQDRSTTLRSKGKLFVMFPAVRNDMDKIDPLPEIGPLEIRRVTSIPPDLTRRHAKEVRQMFDDQRTFCSSITLEEHVRTNPQDAYISELQFNARRERILAQSLVEFGKDLQVREYIWLRHATPAQAKRVGYLDVAEQALIVWRFQQQGFTRDQSWEEIRRLKYVAIYDTPKRTKLYLYDLKEEPILDAKRLANDRARAAHQPFCWHSDDYQVIHLPRGGEFSMPPALAAVFKLLDAAPNKSMKRLSIWERLGKPGAKEGFWPNKIYTRWAAGKKLQPPLLTWRTGAFRLHPPTSRPLRKSVRR